MPAPLTLSGAAAVPVIDVDMDAVYARHNPPAKLWHVEFVCDGQTYVWHGRGRSGAYAELCARSDLSDQDASFSRYGARLVSLASAMACWPCSCARFA